MTSIGVKLPARVAALRAEEQLVRLGLGVTDIDLLRRGGEIDQAAEQRIIQADATERESRPPDLSSTGPARPSNQRATIVNDDPPMVELSSSPLAALDAYMSRVSPELLEQLRPRTHLTDLPGSRRQRRPTRALV
jgi:hypothetical protein